MYYSVIDYLPWLAILIAFGTIKDNRTRKALYILIPLLIANCIWLSFKKISGMPSSEIELNLTFHCFAIGLTVLWLTAQKFKNLHGLLRLFLCLLMMLFILLMGVFYFSRDNKLIMVFVLFIFISLAMMLGFATSAKLCRKKYRPVAFSLWSILFLPVWGIIGMGGYVVTLMVITHERPPMEIILQVVFFGIIVGLLLFAINLPFLIVGFTVPFYRERFCDCLRLKTVTEQNNIEPIEEQNTV